MDRDRQYPQTEATGPKLVAVIDIGASSLRMQIAEISDNGAVRNLESFSQALSIGKDSFSKGSISKSTIENCVHVLSIYRAKLDEYSITHPANIRVIATSGVNEASNRLAFLDRIYVATGFEIGPFDEAELHRITFLGLRQLMKSDPDFFKGETLAVEIGGGSTETLWLSNTNVTLSRVWRLGALRMRQKLERYDAPLVKSRDLMERQVRDTIEQIKDSTDGNPDRIIAMGGDIRFAARKIIEGDINKPLVELKLKSVEKFLDTVLESSPERLSTEHHMSIPDAQLLGPGLLAICTFARAFGVDKLIAANVNLRDGLISEMAKGSGWSHSVREQIIRSVLQLGRKYNFNEPYSVHVSMLACQLFDQLEVLHGLSEHYRDLLQISAILHQIGTFINTRASHKHSMYLINHSEFFGVSREDRQLVALLTRYHRRAAPSSRHVGYSSLSRDKRVAISKLASILRVAIALNVSHGQRIKKVTCKLLSNELRIVTSDVSDLTLERMELRQAGQLFEDIFGKPVTITGTSNSAE